MTNRTKMYTTNGKARAWLLKNGFIDIHFFPHTRFSKDAHFAGLGWDGIATLGKKLVLFQTKTNCACTKTVREQMKAASYESGVILIWINAKTRKGLEITVTPTGMIKQLKGGQSNNGN